MLNIQIRGYLLQKSQHKDIFTRKLHGLSDLSYIDRLRVLGLETLEHRRLIHDLIICYKIFARFN